MNEEILKADKEYRRKVLFLFAFLITIGAIVLIFGLPCVMDDLEMVKPHNAIIIIYTVLIFAFFSMIPWGLYMIKLSKDILREGQFPTQKMKVITDTHIIRGQRARKRGYIFQFLALLIILMSLMSIILINYFFIQLKLVF